MLLQLAITGLIGQVADEDMSFLALREVVRGGFGHGNGEYDNGWIRRLSGGVGKVSFKLARVVESRVLNCQ